MAARTSQDRRRLRAARLKIDGGKVTHHRRERQRRQCDHRRRRCSRTASSTSSTRCSCLPPRRRKVRWRRKADNPMVGGAPMYADKNIVENAVNSKDHTTLVAAVQGRRPCRDAFRAPVRSRCSPRQRGLRRAAGRHGRHAAEAREQGRADQDPDLPCRRRQALGCRPDEEGQGRWRQATTWRPSSGDALTADGQGGKTSTSSTKRAARRQVTIADVNQSNGVIHVIDKVLLPK